jgi:uracil-DNA glycosylase family 4
MELSNEIEHHFNDLCSSVLSCQACLRMAQSTRVLNRSAGSLNAKIMFIGEAPGSLGADGSGIPFHGDQAGHNFEELLQFAQIDRSSIYVTNAVLCNPKNEDGNNATPALEEIKNCSKFLKAQIEIVNPQIIVTLGSVSLKALSLIEPHKLNLKENVRTSNIWLNRILIPVYHPGQRAMLHRSFANQRSDYQFIEEHLRRLNKGKRKISGKTKADVALIVQAMLEINSRISYFSLHKLFYLIENKYVKEYNSRLTNAYFVRQKDGPYCTDLHLNKLKKALQNVELKTIKGILFFEKRNQLLLFNNSLKKNNLSDDIFQIVKNIMDKYADFSHADLKRVVYLTSPMKNMLRIEKNDHVNLYNAPIDFLGK